jgi:hypothetical protein
MVDDFVWCQSMFSKTSVQFLILLNDINYSIKAFADNLSVGEISSSIIQQNINFAKSFQTSCSIFSTSS